MKKVMCFGTFDYLHLGHEFFLKEAKKLGEKLVVVIALDTTVKKVKGKIPLYSQDQRKKDVEKLGIASKVILGNEEDKYQVIEDEKPNIIALGYDQNTFVEKLEEELLKRNLKCEIVRIKSYEPEKYKSSKLKKLIFLKLSNGVN